MKKITLAEIKRRLSDKITLGLLATAVFGFLLNIGVMDEMAVSQYTEAFNYLVGVLVVLGIVRDPKKPVEE